MALECCWRAVAPKERRRAGRATFLRNSSRRSGFDSHSAHHAFSLVHEAVRQAVAEMEARIRKTRLKHAHCGPP